jgi:hypothetical protein
MVNVGQKVTGKELKCLAKDRSENTKTAYGLETIPLNLIFKNINNGLVFRRTGPAQDQPEHPFTEPDSIRPTRIP